MNTTSPSVSRNRASEIIGVTAGTLRNWACQKPPRGPAPIKTGGSKQARVLYSLAEIERWRSDPTGYRPQPSSPRCRQKNEGHR
jgi:hypothetical protein